MKIVTLWQPQHTDGDRYYPEDVYFQTLHEADAYTREKYGAYGAGPKEVKAICENGEYYLLQQESPVYLHNSDLDKEKRKQEVLSKLSPEERELLGV